jgi:hypothetical protein
LFGRFEGWLFGRLGNWSCLLLRVALITQLTGHMTKLQSLIFNYIGFHPMNVGCASAIGASSIAFGLNDISN